MTMPPAIDAQIGPQRVPCTDGCLGLPTVTWLPGPRLPPGINAVGASLCPVCQRVALQVAGRPSDPDEYRSFVAAMEQHFVIGATVRGGA